MKISFILASLGLLFSFSGRSQCDASFNAVTTGVPGCAMLWVEPVNYNPALYYHYNFGDGGSSDNAYISHVYAANGNYAVTLTVTDSMNTCADSVTQWVNIYCDSLATDSCNAAFDYGFVTCDSVYFWPLSYNAGTHIWSFGDGSYSYDVYPAHTYASDGVYMVTLTISDSLNNCTDVVSNWVTVLCDSIPADSCSAMFDYQYVTCDSIWFYPLNYDQSVSYSWYFGDGASGNDIETAHQYASDGTYNVTLTVIDSLNNCWHSVTKPVTIACDSVPVDSCYAQFDFQYLTCDSIWFFPVNYDPSISYSWYFGDGASGNDVSPAHQYAFNGTYNVTLTVIDSLNNCWHSVTKPVTIACDSVPVDSTCNAEFGYSFATCDSVWFAPEVYEPTAFYIWNFGEGASGYGAYTSHQYTQDGTYTVTLTVVDCANDCWATYITTITVDCDSTLGITPVENGKSLRVYPNPGTGIFNVELESKGAVVQVYDLSGNLVVNTRCTEDDCRHFELDLSHLANGAYSLVLIEDGEMQSTQIVKQ